MVEKEGRREAAKMGKQEEREMELLLDEIPHATSPHLNHRRRHHNLHHGGEARAADADVRIRRGMYVSGLDELSLGVHGHGHAHARGYDACVSPPPLPSEGSSSSSGSGLLSGRLSPVTDEPHRRRPPSSAEERMVEELGLLDKLRDIRLGVDRKVPIGHPASSRESSPIGPSLFQTNRRNDVAMEGLVHRGYAAYCHSRLPNSLLFNMDKSSYFAQLKQHYSVDAPSVDSWLENYPYRATELGTDGVLRRNSSYMGNYGGGFASPINGTYPISDMFLPPENVRVDPNWDRSALDASKLHHNYLALNGHMESHPVNVRPQPVRMLRNSEAFGSEDSLIIEGKGLRDMRNQWNDLLKETKRSQFDEQLHAQGISVKVPTFPLKYDNLMGVKGCMYYVAKDQHGCRFLQRKLDEGKLQVDTIFNGIIEHAIELMVDTFGNYLMQKLLEVCSEEQLMEILLVLNEDPADLVRISLNIHGTRAMQKLIDTLRTRQQIALVISALRPGFLDLIKDLNGSHVLQRCLESFTAEDNKFIFDAAAKNCVDIATHRHGCCVLQKCIAHSTGDDQAKLVAEISANGYELALDPFGNYVVQYIVNLKNPLAIANLVCQFEGKYVQLSIQKFSSNVVENCLKFFGEDDRTTIIVELLSVSHFEQLLQDPYANYVIQSALQNSKGSLHAALEEAIRPHAAALRTSPFCKRIFSRALLKK